VTLTVSHGGELKTLDDYIGKKRKDVKKTLKEMGIDDTQIDVTTRYDDQPEDTILEQSPKPDEEFDPAKVEVKIVVSLGKEKHKMPDLTGKTVEETDAILLQKNLSRVKGKEGITEQHTFLQPKGKIFDQWPYKPDQEVESG